MSVQMERLHQKARNWMEIGAMLIWYSQGWCYVNNISIFSQSISISLYVLYKDGWWNGPKEGTSFRTFCESREEIVMMVNFPWKHQSGSLIEDSKQTSSHMLFGLQVTSMLFFFWWLHRKLPMLLTYGLFGLQIFLRRRHYHEIWVILMNIIIKWNKLVHRFLC